VKVCGIVKTTLLDYPGKLASVFFVGGCNFLCPYCHNSDLVLKPDSLPTVSEGEIFSFLKKRKKILEGVCISGGEPMLYKELEGFVKDCKKLGYLVKVDTNGSNPELLVSLIKKKLVDYAAVDYKGPFGKYGKYIGKKDSDNVAEKVKQTIGVLVGGKIDFELRTTVVPTLHSKADLVDMADDLVKIIGKGRKKVKWFWQNFRPVNCIEPKFNEVKPYPKKWFEEVLGKIRYKTLEIKLRGVD